MKKYVHTSVPNTINRRIAAILLVGPTALDFFSIRKCKWCEKWNFITRCVIPISNVEQQNIHDDNRINFAFHISSNFIVRKFRSIRDIVWFPLYFRINHILFLHAQDERTHTRTCVRQPILFSIGKKKKKKTTRKNCFSCALTTVFTSWLTKWS